MTSCFSELPGARPPPLAHLLSFGRSSQSNREPVSYPCCSRALTVPARDPLLQGFGARGTIGVGAVAWVLQLLPLATGPAPASPSFSKLLQPTSRSPRPSAPRSPLPYLSPGNTWSRGSPERSFFGVYSLTREERGTETQKGDPSRCLGVFPPAQPSWGGDGCPWGRRGNPAARLELGSAGSSACSGIRGSSSPCPLPATKALRRPAPSRLVSPAATLSAQPCPRAQSPPPPHNRARAHTDTRARARTLEHETTQWEPAPLR